MVAMFQDMEGMYQTLFHEGNRDVYVMSITFGKRGANISNRHIDKYQELMAEWARDGIFAEGITMTERGAK
jgi:phage terminase large subunit-like protein